MIDDEEFERLAAQGLLPEIPEPSNSSRAAGDQAELPDGVDSPNAKPIELRPITEGIRGLDDKLESIDKTLTYLSGLLTRVMEG